MLKSIQNQIQLYQQTVVGDKKLCLGHWSLVTEDSSEIIWLRKNRVGTIVALTTSDILYPGLL